MREISNDKYFKAEVIVVLIDNLNTHSPSSF
jgi:hypothetical protein